MPPPSHQELHRDRGILTGRHRPVWRHWREPYVFALAISWPAFLALIAGLFLAINLLFAALHRLDPAGIAGGAQPRASFAESFFFSVQTLGSIGYGVLHPVDLYANLLVTAESLCGLLFVAITTGLAFARSNARIPASDRRRQPLHGLSPADLRSLNAEGVVAFSGVDETIERPVHAQAQWSVEQLRFGCCFVDILEDHPSGDGPPRRINWAAFDRIRPCPQP